MIATGGLQYDRYFVHGHPEWLMRIGSAGGMPILLLPPLFEEMNRTRAMLVAVMRALAVQGFCTWLPDLPGTGESERSLEECGWEDWSAAVKAVAEQARSPDGALTVVSFRGGALLDQVSSAAHWRFAPVEGASLIRDLSRSGLVGGESQAGYLLSDQLAEGLGRAIVPEVAPCRTVRLASDPRAADLKLDGPSLWRRSEPSTSSGLTALISSDMADWARSCGSC